MAVYHPKTNAGVVHYSTRTDLPSKKVFSWGSDAEGLEWRNALSDNHSAYVEIQAGLFRDQETYGFLDPQQAIHFTEIWLPVLEIGGITLRESGRAAEFDSRAIRNAGKPFLWKWLSTSHGIIRTQSCRFSMESQVIATETCLAHTEDHFS